jgi:hypothetical protein
MRGPFTRYRETASTLNEARAIALRMNIAHGRRACIYAITDDGAAVPVR